MCIIYIHTYSYIFMYIHISLLYVSIYIYEPSTTFPILWFYISIIMMTTHNVYEESICLDTVLEYWCIFVVLSWASTYDWCALLGWCTNYAILDGHKVIDTSLTSASAVELFHPFSSSDLNLIPVSCSIALVSPMGIWEIVHLRVCILYLCCRFSKIPENLQYYQ